ncbi:hypothetical protein [Desulforamulus hydrothermalis]|uniref:Uncharacterized protein n=1 Tax=Desulforamulus hydrothermalis Lam5 = DSM 18033 TaxID=1121428 RepID=K8DWY1_9FIRM|nr:hypothetical protein [Desulforamulus hydrothermalis]CCO07017.1 conserved hypothetical protein [Desulforamulus hydrothermalis Lam5 = DSM 18033]SHG97501.1 hypothetical protein SAMN02745177_00961 [Desulforamulus hydrothermalis Lam5 = DSM 18033]
MAIFKLHELLSENEDMLMCFLNYLQINKKITEEEINAFMQLYEEQKTVSQSQKRKYRSLKDLQFIK